MNMSPEERFMYNEMCKTAEKDILIDPKRRDKYLKAKRERERTKKQAEELRRKVDPWLY